jgi:PAS domain S-box-containing protein
VVSKCRPKTLRQDTSERTFALYSSPTRGKPLTASDVSLPRPPDTALRNHLMKLLLQETDSTEHLYRLILDNALDSYIAIDEHSTIIEWSDQAERTFGWTRQEACGRSLTGTIIPERYRAAHLAGLQHYLESGEHKILNRRIELSALHKDGAEIPVELTVTPITTARGVMFSASMRDISQRKELEQVVQHQANITKSILDSMADAVVVADLAENLILVNPAAQRLLTLKPVEAGTRQSFRAFEVCQEDMTTRYPDSDRPLSRALRGEQVDDMIVFVRCTDTGKGVWLSANARPLMDRSGVLIGGVVVFHDITELREREEALARQALALRQSQENYRLLVESSTDYAMLMLDSGGTILSWSAGAEIILGHTAEQAVGQPLSAIFTSEDREMGQPLHELEVARTRGRSEDNRWHLRRDGSRFWAEGVVTPLWKRSSSPTTTCLPACLTASISATSCTSSSPSHSAARLPSPYCCSTSIDSNMSTTPSATILATCY